MASLVAIGIGGAPTVLYAYSMALQLKAYIRIRLAGDTGGFNEVEKLTRRYDPLLTIDRRRSGTTETIRSGDIEICVRSKFSPR